MKLCSNINQCSVVFWNANAGEVNARTLEVDFCEEICACNKAFAVFTLADGTQYLSEVIDGKAEIPVFAASQYITIGVYAYSMDGEELKLRYSPMPAKVFVNAGSYTEGASAQTFVSVSTVEAMTAEISKKANTEDLPAVIDTEVNITDLATGLYTINGGRVFVSENDGVRDYWEAGLVCINNDNQKIYATVSGLAKVSGLTTSIAYAQGNKLNDGWHIYSQSIFVSGIIPAESGLLVNEEVIPSIAAVRAYAAAKSDIVNELAVDVSHSDTQIYNANAVNSAFMQIVEMLEGGGNAGTGSGTVTGAGVTEAQKQTLLAIVNAIGLFNVPNAQTLLDNFNKAWNTVDPVPATSVTLDKTEITFTAEETQTIIASVLPANTTDVVVWTSSNNAVATVKNGVVTPLVDGETVITATAGNVSASCAVTVNMFGEIENAVFVSSGVIGTQSTATSEPVAKTDYPNSVTFSAIPVKVGTTLTCQTDIFKPNDWVWFFIYDTDGLNCERKWFTDTTAGTTTATKDGFIRVSIMRQSTHTFTTDNVIELSTTTNGEKTTYTLVDRR